jgi:hypothetical protein
MKLRAVLVAASLVLRLRHSERQGFTFSGRLKASDSTTVAAAFASVNADYDNGTGALQG